MKIYDDEKGQSLPPCRNSHSTQITIPTITVKGICSTSSPVCHLQKSHLSDRMNSNDRRKTIYTSCPAICSKYAIVSPAIPAPTMAMSSLIALLQRGPVRWLQGSFNKPFQYSGYLSSWPLLKMNEQLAKRLNMISAILRPRPSRPGPRAPHKKGPPTFQCLSMLD